MSEHTTGDMAKALGVTRATISHIVKHYGVAHTKIIGPSRVYGEDAFSAIRREHEKIKKTQKARFRSADVVVIPRALAEKLGDYARLYRGVMDGESRWTAKDEERYLAVRGELQEELGA